jgi:hypothetical protein
VWRTCRRSKQELGTPEDEDHRGQTVELPRAFSSNLITIFNMMACLPNLY